MKTADIKVEVGRRIRVLRERRNWSQEELGFASGLHRNYIGGIERGERNATVLSIGKIAAALRVRPRELLP